MTRRLGARRPPLSVQHRLTAREDEILTRAPLLQASLQMDGGDPGERGPKPCRWFWDVCPPLRTLKATDANLVGLRFGRMVCVGLLDRGDRPASGNKNASWVVRCDCGRYETRKARTIRNPRNPQEACQSCDYMRHLRRVAHFDRTGRWPATEWEAA